MRTNATAVRQICEIDPSIVSSDAKMEPYLVAAGLLVDAHCVAPYAADDQYSDAQLKVLETWLAAHLYKQVDPTVASEGAEGIFTAYAGTMGQALSSTRYGQTAMALDSKGGLARFNASVVKGTAGRRTSITMSRNRNQRTN
jgi:hypothetical protein